MNRATRLSTFGVLGMFTLVLSACPYHGRVPLGEPVATDFDNALIGEWVVEPTGDQKEGRVRIARYDDDEYVMAGMGDCPNASIYGHLTKVAGHRFMNVRDPSEPGLYYIARVQLRENRLVMWYLNDSLDSTATSQLLRSIVEKKIDDPAIYDDSVTFHRTGTTVRETGARAVALGSLACPYDADVSLESPEATPDLAKLVGAWNLIDAQNDTTRVNFTRSGDRQLSVDLGAVIESSAGTQMNGYVTRINGKNFLNLRSEKKDNHVTIARLDISGNTLTLRQLNVGVHGSTPAELRRAITGHVDDPAIYYWEPLKLVRVSQ